LSDYVRRQDARAAQRRLNSTRRPRVSTRLLDDKSVVADDRRDENLQRALSALGMTTGSPHSDPVGW
jgi:hypothetical protein